MSERTVTLELDNGPYTMTFGYEPFGEPAYADVPAFVGVFPTEMDAERAGAAMLAVGNWRSFTIRKRYGVLS